MIARLVHNWDDLVFKTVMVQSVQQLSLYPRRLYGLRREDYSKPITALKCRSNLIMPLLRA